MTGRCESTERTPAAAANPDPATVPAPPPAALPTGTDRLIYEIERLQRELDGLQREMAWSHRLTTLGTLAAVAVHEVNNILTPVASYAQLALSEPGDARLTEKALTISVENVRRATRIFSATLGFARDDSAAARCDPAVVLDAAVRCLVREPHRDGITLTADLAPAALAINPTELQQVLLNLLLNARKALLATRTEDAGITVTGRLAPKGRGYTLTLADTGPGIPARAMATLFEPFVTVGHDNAAASDALGGDLSTDGGVTASRADFSDMMDIDPARQRGTGLGLAVCKRLIESAGGTIGVSSKPGRGAVFTITLPVAE